MVTQIPGYVRKDSEKNPYLWWWSLKGPIPATTILCTAGHEHYLLTKQLILRWGYPWVRGTTGSLEDDKHPRHSGGIEWSLLSQAILLVQVYIVQIQNPFRNRIGWDECWSDNDLVMCIVFGLSLLSARLVLILIEKLPQIIVK